MRVMLTRSMWGVRTAMGGAATCFSSKSLWTSPRRTVSDERQDAAATTRPCAAGAIVNAKTEADEVPIAMATDVSESGVLEEGDEANAKSQYAPESCPLRIAASIGRETAISALVKAGADKSVKNADGFSPVQVTIQGPTLTRARRRAVDNVVNGGRPAPRVVP